MKKKRDYIVMNFDNGSYWLASDCASPKEAVERYLREAEPTSSFSGYVVKTTGKYEDFDVTVQAPFIIEGLK